MSENIFNIIKYSISLPVTGEKLDILPRPLYKKWVNYIIANEAWEGRKSYTYYHVYAFAEFFNKIPSKYQDYYIKELHKRILCYSEE